MKQGGLKSGGWIGRPLLTMRLSIAGIAVRSCRSSGLYARNEKGRSRQWEELRAMRQCRSSTGLRSEAFDNQTQKEACALSLLRLPRHPFHGALKWKDEREWPGALLARRTRTIRMCSFDARSKGQPRPLPLRKSVRKSEEPRSTRAIEDQPGHLLEKQTSKLEETIVCQTRASGDKPRCSGTSRSPPHPSVERVDPARRFYTGPESRTRLLTMD